MAGLPFLALPAVNQGALAPDGADGADETAVMPHDPVGGGCGRAELSKRTIDTTPF